MIFDTEPQNWSELQNYVGKMFEEFEQNKSKLLIVYFLLFIIYTML